mgnify:CR=1 FL=1
MDKLKVFDMEGKVVGEAELDEKVFGIKPNEEAVRRMVLSRLANDRKGCASTKKRGAVSGGGKKPWKQKHTGRARQGSTRAPQWRHGGIVFGPHPREYGFDVPVEMKRLAMRSALAVKLRDGEFRVVDKIAFGEPKTKEAMRVMKNLGVEGGGLFVDVKVEGNFRKSVRNVPGAKAVNINNVNVYDVVAHSGLVFTLGALGEIQKTLGADN